ncbi:MAG: hypothetical protein FJ276_32820 [Planctomycetes bacterium]|nr:hypothetical protein [Planctomycetota bacterium]
MFADLSSRILDVFHYPGRAYRDVLLVVLVGTALAIVLHGVLALFGRKETRRRKPWNLWEKLVYLAALVSIAVLAITSFYTVLRFGHMVGWWLFVHMFGAGMLVGVLPLLALTWGSANRFEPGGSTPPPDADAPRFFWMPKFLFWLFVGSSLVVVLTMLLSMLPLFGTDGLLRLLDLHRYTGLLAVAALTLHLYCVMLQKVGLR